MPKTPPKQWWNKCIKSVNKSKKIYNPQAICGNIWYHKLSQKQKLAITKKSE